MRGMEPKPGREQQQQQDPPKGPPPEEEEWNDLVKQHKVLTVQYTLRGCPTSPAARPWCGSTCWCNFILTSHRPPSNNWAPLQVHAAGHITGFAAVSAAAVGALHHACPGRRQDSWQEAGVSSVATSWDLAPGGGEGQVAGEQTGTKTRETHHQQHQLGMEGTTQVNPCQSGPGALVHREQVVTNWLLGGCPQSVTPLSHVPIHNR